jgi:hypothetical protein
MSKDNDKKERKEINTSETTHCVALGREDEMSKKMKTNNQAMATTKEEARRAFERMKQRIMALPANELLPVRTDLPKAVSVVLGAEAGLRAVEGEIKKTVPSFDVSDLRDVALAASYANTVVSEHKAAEPDLHSMIEEATALRHSLLVHADALAERGLVDASSIANIREGRGHLDLAQDMLALNSLFRAAWSEIKDRTLVESSELDRADELGTNLLTTLGKNEVRQPNTEPDDHELRVRAFSLLAKKYGEVQRAVVYVRHEHGDAKEIAPTIYFRGARSGTLSDNDQGSEEVAPVAPAVTAPTPPVITAPAAPATSVPPTNG